MSKALQKYTDKAEELDLSPEQRAAVRLYTDPLLPEYGNMSAVARKVGRTPQAIGQWMREGHPVRQMVDMIERERDAAGKLARDHLVRHSHDAARELVKQLSVGRDLEHVDTTEDMKELDRLEEAIGKGVTGGADPSVQKANAKLLTEKHKAIVKKVDVGVKHNRAVNETARLRREAAEAILKYTVDDVRGRKGGDGGPIDLAELSDDELAALGGAVTSIKENRKGRAAEIVVEAEEEGGV